MPSLADRQLAAWQELARGWLANMTRQEGRCLYCKTCGRSILLIIDALGHPYHYGDDGRLALTVLHLRSHHTDLDPDKAL